MSACISPYIAIVSRNHKNQFRNLGIKPRSKRFQNHVNGISELRTPRTRLAQPKGLQCWNNTHISTMNYYSLYQLGYVNYNCRTRGVSNRTKWCPRFQDFIGISGFLWDFNISQRIQDVKISYRFYDLIIIDFKILMRFHRISCGSHSILINISVWYIQKKYCSGFQISDFSSDFSICVQDSSLLRTPRQNLT